MKFHKVIVVWLKLLSKTIFYFVIFTMLFIFSLLLANVPLTAKNIALFLSLNYEPKGVYDAIALIIVFFLELSPLMAFVELSMLSDEEICEIKASALENHIIVIGCGHLGKRVIKILEDMNRDYALIVLPEDREKNEFIRQLLRKRKPVIFGDATVPEILLKANLKKARSLIVTVNDDHDNLAIGKIAKNLNPKIKVVLRIFDEDIAELAMKAGIADEVLSTTKVAVKNYIIGAYLNIAPFKLSPVTIEISKDSPLKGKKVEEIEKFGLKIAIIVRGEDFIRPSPDDELNEGDFVLILGNVKDFGRLLKSLSI